MAKRFGTVGGLFVALVAVTAAGAQDLTATVSALLSPNSRARALGELAAAGPDGAAAVLDAWEAADARSTADAAVFAAALAELGAATAPLLPRLCAAFERAPVAERDVLLRALVNGVLLASGEARATIEAKVQRWAAAGWLYSPSSDAPSFAWYEYVRLRVRLRAARHGTDPHALASQLAELTSSRGSINFGNFASGGPYAIEQHGAHGQREQLEAIGELAAASRDPAEPLASELAKYLEASAPRPPFVLVEQTAGIGEEAPADLPGAKWPTRWRRDDWHFACARAVLAHSKDPTERDIALRHLLFAPEVPVRAQAFADLRQHALPLTAFAGDLAECLRSADRGLVREALIAIGLDKATSEQLGGALQPIANGSDKELALLARRALGAR